MTIVWGPYKVYIIKFITAILFATGNIVQSSGGVSD